MVLLFVFEPKHFTIREAFLLLVSTVYIVFFTEFELRNLSYYLSFELGEL